MTLSDELDKLDELHRRAALSDDEFARAKARLLDGAAPRPMPAALNALRRSRDDVWLGGVCGGLEPFSGIAAWIWRLIFAALVLCGGTGIVVYLLLWLFVPQDEARSFGGDARRDGPVRTG